MNKKTLIIANFINRELCEFPAHELLEFTPMNSNERPFLFVFFYSRELE